MDSNKKEYNRKATENKWQFFFIGSDSQCTTTIEQYYGGDEPTFSFLGQTNVYLIIAWKA